jgi:serine/threonine protein kinase
MPIILKPGKIIKGYEVVKELNRGSFAIAYEAKTIIGERVFLKQYKLPTPVTEWFSDFVIHQEQIKQCIGGDSNARDGCYKIIEFFEDLYFYQVFEYIDGGLSLTYCLDHYASYSWDTWVGFAKAMMFAIKALHEQNIVHCDLKPGNLILIPNANIGIGYKLRVIDFDWAFFSDKQAPWHGKHGYVGTPYYMSPEHIDGKVPTHASDIFTCGIILGLMLGDQHPFHENLDETYEHFAFKGYFSPIKLKQSINDVNDLLFLEAILNACLNPDPNKRPTAKQICSALSDR